MRTRIAAALVGTPAFTTAIPMARAQSRYDELANLPFNDGFIARGKDQALLDPRRRLVHHPPPLPPAVEAQ
jgi:hypothetical protein